MDANTAIKVIQIRQDPVLSPFLCNIALTNLKRDLICHPLYASVNSFQALRVFMEAHVFAVWDFMSLAKRLQISLTCTSLPWFPPVDADAARFINEIVLNEESDLSPLGKPQSHLEMYRDAMDEMGASTDLFDRFCLLLKQGVTVQDALNQADAPRHVIDFVSTTMAIALRGSIVEVASFFLYGREDPIPDMFQTLMQRWGMQNTQLPKLCWYLDRHIQLDGEEHGPAANKLLKLVTGGEPAKLRCAYQAALAAVQARIQLWNGILRDIQLAEDSVW